MRAQMAAYGIILSFITLISAAHARTLIIVCDGMNTPSKLTIYVNQETGTVRVHQLDGYEYLRPATISGRSIKWAADALNHFTLDRYSGLLSNPLINTAHVFA